MEMQMAPASREFFGIAAWRNHIIVTSGMHRSMSKTAQVQNTITKLAPSFTLSDGGTLSACQVFSPDCWMQVISFLEADDICRLGAVSKELYCICVKDEVGHAGCLLNNDSFMFVGSSNANPQCEFFHFDTNTFTWRKMEMQMAPASREFFGITAWRNHIIVTSGMWRSMTKTAQEQNTITKLAPSLTLSDGGTLSACQVFPPDCWMQVISFLEADDICRLGAVSKELYCICVKDEVWKKFLPVELHGGTGLKALCIPAWKNPSPLVPIGPVSHYTGPEPPSCFLGDGRVLMSDGTTKTVCNIQPGDCVMTENNRGRAVALIQSSTRTNPMRLAFINGIGLTTGHPVWQQHQHQQSVDGHCGETGEWVRACDHKDAVLRVVADVGTLYNFVLEGGPQEPDHSVIINSSVIVCTLGKDCGPVMREKYPRADMLYGTGYWKRETKE
ncbi:hypothetical protein Pelo_9435 [Pelomyxa schiedti]|nr:hypothetical protein Pelo_9435 [Pelomyxa schiedti]